jgi:hypothetical protein
MTTNLTSEPCRRVKIPDLRGRGRRTRAKLVTDVVRFEVFKAVTTKNDGGAIVLRNVGSYKSHTV